MSQLVVHGYSSCPSGTGQIWLSTFFWRYCRDPHSAPSRSERRMLANGSQNSLLIAATGNALTTVFAGFAFTTISLPNITFLVAFVAGFFLVFTMQRPGNVNLPSPFSSCVAMPPREPMTFEHSLFFRPVQEYGLVLYRKLSYDKRARFFYLLYHHR